MDHTDQIIESARAAVKSENPAETIRLCETVLATDPDNADALVLLGAAYFKDAETQDQGVKCLRRALKIDPKHAEAHYTIGLVLAGEKNDEDAVKSFRNAVLHRPDYAAAHLELGKSLFHRLNISEAEEYLREAARLGADKTDADLWRGLCRFRLSDMKGAAQIFRSVIETAPGNADAHHGLGLSLLEQGLAEEAEQSYKRCLEIQPAHDGALRGLGRILLEKKDYPAAADVFKIWTEADRSSAEAWALRRLAHLRAGLEDPEFPPIEDLDYASSVGLGQACMAHSYLDEEILFVEAERCYRHAGVVGPKEHMSRAYLCEALAFQGRISDSLSAALEGINIAPHNPTMISNLSAAYRSNGQMAEGFNLSEVRLSIPRTHSTMREFPIPRWEDQPLEGKTLYIWREEGVGDEIRYASCIADVLEKLPCQVIWECAPRFQPLFARSLEGARVIAEDLSANNFEGADYHIPVMSLAMHFRRNLSDFPGPGGYLKADPDAVTQWRERLAELGPEPKIAVCWRSLNLSWRKRPFISRLSDWAPIMGLKGVKFINIQPETTAPELEFVRQTYGPVLDAFEDLDLKNDLDGTAALISACDAVVTARCMVSGLAGALGKETYLFCAHPNADMAEQEYDPWFPDVDVFYRKFGEPWDETMAEIAAMLDEKFNGPNKSE